MLDATAAAADGVARPSTGPGGEPVHGVGPRTLDTWIGRLDNFALGDEQVSHVSVQVSAFSRGMSVTDIGSLTPHRVGNTPSMFIGDDFLRAHRVFVDNGDHLVLFSYLGGPVFSAPVQTAARTAPK
jgi:hypothetical protein